MSCTYYEFKGGFIGGDYWCRKKDCRVDDGTYYRYCRGYNYDECPIYQHQESSGCFITTVACQILGEEDNSSVLNDFRKFRENILQKNTKYYDILKEYDVIGPKIANALFHDKDREEMAKGLYQNAILPVHRFILEENYDKAVETYYVMTLMLVNYYGFKREYNEIKDQDYGYSSLEFNPKISGHGMKKVKRKEK